MRLDADTARDGKVRLLRGRAHHPHDYLAALTLRIENYTHIRRAYGAEIARAAIGHLRTTVADCLQLPHDLVDHQDGNLTVYVRPGPQAPEVNPNWAAERLQKLCSIVPLLGCNGDAGPLHLVLSGTWELPPLAGVPGRPSRSGEVAARFCGQPPGHSEQWAGKYRSDMSACAEVLGSLAEGALGYAGLVSRAHRQQTQLAFAWEPVIDAAGSAAPLLFDARAGLIDRRGVKQDLSAQRAALERLGLARILDQFLVDAVFYELQENPDIILSATISAHSVGDAIWWPELIRRMSFDPGVASRLVVTMSEGAAVPDMSSAVLLVRQLQSVGVKFAIDNFGIGFASIRELIALSPDIARIDPFFLQWRGRGSEAGSALGDLARFARSLAAVVVIGGIADEDQRQMALAAGLRWQQGLIWGAPGCVRPWRTSPGVACMLIEQLETAASRRELSI